MTPTQQELCKRIVAQAIRDNCTHGLLLHDSRAIKRLCFDVGVDVFRATVRELKPDPDLCTDNIDSRCQCRDCRAARAVDKADLGE